MAGNKLPLGETGMSASADSTHCRCPVESATADFQFSRREDFNPRLSAPFVIV